MELVELTEYLVKNIVEDEESVAVQVVCEDEVTVIEVKVSENDISSVIGKGGVIANSIRTLVQASAYNKKLGKVRINIDTI